MIYNLYTSIGERDCFKHPAESFITSYLQLYTLLPIYLATLYCFPIYLRSVGIFFFVPPYSFFPLYLLPTLILRTHFRFKQWMR